VNKIKLDQRNYRIHGEKNLRLIGKSLADCGAGRSILIDGDDCIIAGNGVFQKAQELNLPVRIIESDGTELIAVKRTDLATDDARRKALAFADNHTSDTSVFDTDLIIEDFSAEELGAWEFNVGDLSVGDEWLKPSINKVGSIEDKFIIPPFSILDTRAGRWTRRKEEWMNMGIKSEIGRDSELTYSRSSQPPRIYDIRNRIREKSGKDPSWEEVLDYCKKNSISTMESTSIFDPVLCELAYRWFNTENGFILDPFAGGSVRGIVAAKLGMNYYGVDLRREQTDANYRNAKDVLGEGYKPFPYWCCDDSLNIDKLFYKEKFDLLFTCPPYGDLEVYSDDRRDLSTMKYEDFIAAYREIIRKSCNMLNENRFAVFVVSEIRDRSGAYRNFVSDTICAFADCRISFYNEMILVNPIGSLAIRISKQFNHSRKIGRHHQNALVFYKGNPTRISEKYPALDFSDDILFTEDY
jgi:DNA modification methylase